MGGDSIRRAVPRKRIRHGPCSQRRVPVSLERCVRGVDWRWILGGVGMERGQRALHLTLKSMQCHRPSVAIRRIDYHSRANQFPLFSLRKLILEGELWRYNYTIICTSAKQPEPVLFHGLWTAACGYVPPGNEEAEIT